MARFGTLRSKWPAEDMAVKIKKLLISRGGYMAVTTIADELKVSREEVQAGLSFMTGDTGLIRKRRGVRSGLVTTYSYSVSNPAARSRVSERETYTGEDWSASCSRSGCLDHMQYGSRRGDEVVPYQGIRGI